jgi:DNA-binding transcriptional MerR regulator
MTQGRYRLPNEVATQLQISPSTLRRWSKEFGPFLSDTAGRPHDEDEGKFSHRRYTDQDLETLMTVKGLLVEGLTYPQVTSRLEALRLQKTGPDMLAGDDILVEDDEDPVTTLAPSSQDAAYNPAVTVLADTLHTVADGQQLLLGSQQANRDLLTVVLQDNFNLKQENAKLRDRMLELERDLISTRRREHSQRRNLEARLRRVEEQLRPKEHDPEQNNRRGCLGRILGI